MTDTIVTITGKVIDVGDIKDGRGFLIEEGGEMTGVIGLTIEQTKAIGALLGEQVTITVSAHSISAPNTER